MNKKESADEMFQKIGYKKVFEDESIIEYFDKVNRNRIMVSKISKTIAAKSGKETVFFTYSEILACAKLIEEMGLEHDSV